MTRLRLIIKIISVYFVRLNFNINSGEFKKIYKNGLVYFFNDTLSNEISIFGIYEKEQLNKIINVMADRKKRYCIDVGANIGNHSLFFSQFFKKVFSFEAHPKIFKVLKINTSKSSNIKIYNTGLSDKKNFLYFSDFQTQNMAGHSLKKNGNIKVKINKLDNIIKIRNKIDFIKIDTEGHEYQVLVGMKKILKTNNPTIMLEFDAKKFEKNNKIIKFLTSLNYKYFYFFDEDFNYHNFRMRNLIFLIIKILFFGLKNNTHLKKIEDFKNQKNYYPDTFVCAKENLLNN